MSRRAVAAFALIFLLGAGLRLWGLEDKSLNEDEFWVVSEAGSSIHYILFQEWKKDIHPPLNLIFFHYWMRIGEADWLLRLPSALFSIATLLLVALLAWELTRSRGVALLSSLFFALSPFAVHFAHYAKGYAFLGLLATASCLFFLRAVRLGASRDLLLLSVVNVLGAYTHYSMLLLILAQNLGFFLRAKGSPLGWKRWFAYQVGTAALGIPWVLPFLHQWLGGRDYALSDDLKLLPLPLRAGYILYCLCLGNSLNPLWLPIVIPAAVAFGLAFLLALPTLWKSGWAGRLLLALLLIPLGIGFARAAMLPKHLYFVLPLFSLALAAGVAGFARVSRATAVLTVGIIASASLVSSLNYLSGRQLHSPPAPWKETANQIRQEVSSPVADILLYPEKSSGTWRHSRMLRRYLPSLEIHFLPIAPDSTEAETLRFIQALPDAPLWAVLHYGGSSATERIRELIKAELERKFRLVGSWDFGRDEHLLEGFLKSKIIKRQPYDVLQLRRYEPTS